MFNIKKAIIAGLSAVGVLTVFALIQAFAPEWVWYLVSAVGLSAAVLIAAWEPKPKRKHWLFLCSYIADNGKLHRAINLKHGQDRPFLDEEELNSMRRWTSFNCMELDDDISELISKMINQQNETKQQDNESEQTAR